LFFKVNSATNFTSCDAYNIYALGGFSGQLAYTLNAQGKGVASGVATFNGFAFYNLVSASASSLNKFLLDGKLINAGLSYSDQISFSASWSYYFTITSQTIGSSNFYTFNVLLAPIGNTVRNPYYMTWENGVLTSQPTITYISQTSTRPLDMFLWIVLPDENSYTNIGNVNCQIITRNNGFHLNSNMVLAAGVPTDYAWRFMMDASKPN